jgi:polypeptide N-acetylgalactosaminyltransferase
LARLPTTSVIVIFYNEVFSVLLRCLHSIYNRTPRELLHEIVLINDNSTKPELYEKLQTYVSDNFEGKVKLVVNKGRLGLIATRMKGAELASGEVIVFLDSHMEVNTNWLPPLLEPIALNRKVATVPNIDDIHADDFEYENLASYLNGGFDWNLRYQYFPLTHQQYPEKDEPFVLAAMTGKLPQSSQPRLTFPIACRWSLRDRARLFLRARRLRQGDVLVQR